MKPFIVAEMSANHLGSLDRALAIVDAAAKAGADAVKLQTWDEMVIDREYVIQDGPWAGRNLAELYREAKTPWDWHAPIFARCQTHGMVGFSTPFDGAALEFLEALYCPIYKIASFEIIDLPLIRKVSATGKPIVISTGMATEEEITAAAQAAEASPQLTLLHCTSAYPADASDSDLSAMQYLGSFPHCRNYGLSDHTEGIGVAVAAVALGASMIEKHLTIARADGGPDAAFSLEPAEFAQLVTECHRAAAATQFPIDWPSYGPKASERPHLALRPSLYIVRDLPSGHTLTTRDVRTARPGAGMAPALLPRVIGKTTNCPAARGTPLTPDLLADWHSIEK